MLYRILEIVIVLLLTQMSSIQARTLASSSESPMIGMQLTASILSTKSVVHLILAISSVMPSPSVGHVKTWNYYYKGLLYSAFYVIQLHVV